MRVRISSDLLDAILTEAAASPDVEACGLLLGQVDEDGEAIEEVCACRNVAADPARRFEIDPAALLAAHRQARAGGLNVFGHYHSHPTGKAEPSARDAADAAPDGRLWLIVARGEVTAWRAIADGRCQGRFDPVHLTIDERGRPTPA